MGVKSERCSESLAEDLFDEAPRNKHVDAQMPVL